MRSRLTRIPRARLGGRRITGQSTTDYAVVVAVVAVAVVSAATYFGAAIEGRLVRLGGELDGNAGVSAVKQARDEEGGSGETTP